LSDESDTIWGTAYDEAAEGMLILDNKIFTADDFAKLEEE
jgi:hypothetical protein